MYCGESAENGPDRPRNININVTARHNEGGAAVDKST
jgi:hypothetical protein